eukprot:TRINITY_DN520_c0_g2_i3.p1 TRINITY_DN520_c0_g2~~TRINITY_DN520_c0_g2_i3.p1  ORF type:complete len:115 (-),score=23.41 TRINITY_DN520_c0_g2_i3:64-408(-)
MCIRDRYQRRVHGDKNIKDSMKYSLIILSLYLAVFALASGKTYENTVNQVFEDIVNAQFINNTGATFINIANSRFQNNRDSKYISISNATIVGDQDINCTKLSHVSIDLSLIHI